MKNLPNTILKCECYLMTKLTRGEVYLSTFALTVFIRAWLHYYFDIAIPQPPLRIGK